jgi:hypothetical protein
MPLTTQPSNDTPHHPRPLIHILALTLLLTLSIASLTTILILSFLNPTLILSLTSFLASSLTPIVVFIAKTTAKLFALYLLYSLLQAIHFCLYMMRRQYEWHRAQEQVFGHAKVYFAN